MEDPRFSENLTFSEEAQYKRWCDNAEVPTDYDLQGKAVAVIKHCRATRYSALVIHLRLKDESRATWRKNLRRCKDALKQAGAAHSSTSASVSGAMCWGRSRSRRHRFGVVRRRVPHMVGLRPGRGPTASQHGVSRRVAIQAKGIIALVARALFIAVLVRRVRVHVLAPALVSWLAQVSNSAEILSSSDAQALFRASGRLGRLGRMVAEHWPRLHA